MRAAAVLASTRAFAERHAALLCFALAAALRFRSLGDAELSVDETWTWYVTDQVRATGAFWKTVSLGVDGPLFVAVNRLFVNAFGLSAGVLRLPQAIFGALSVPLVVSLLRRRAPSLALPVGLLCAASPFLVFYSQDARPYSQLLFFTLLFVRDFESGTGTRPLLRTLRLSLYTILAITSHYYALVFFAAFYLVVLSDHALEGRREALRADFRTGAVTLAASAPFLLPLLAGAGSLSVPYWRLSGITLPGVLVEQFLFLGTSLPGGGATSIVLNVVFVALLLVPLGHAIWKRTRVPEAGPLLTLWWAEPALVVALGAVLGRSLLFYPRGFIPATPLLFAYWVAFTRAMPVSRGKRRAYAALLLVPFFLNALLIATHGQAQPYYRGRSVLAAVARDVERDRQGYDLVLVHHWWMAQFYYYALSHPETVVPLGRDAPAVEQVRELPPDARVLLVVNDLAEQADPEGAVVSALEAERPLVRERPCLYPALQGAGLVCRRILLFGPASR